MMVPNLGVCPAFVLVGNLYKYKARVTMRVLFFFKKMIKNLYITTLVRDAIICMPRN